MSQKHVILFLGITVAAVDRF